MTPFREPATATVDFEHDERWLLIERIVASTAFRKIGTAQDLLRHLARYSICGDLAELSEQRIGQAVFGKFTMATAPLKIVRCGCTCANCA